MAKKTRRKAKRIASGPKTRTITKIKYRTKVIKAKAKRRAKRVASVVARRVRHHSGRAIARMGGKKEVLTNAAFVAGGFLAGMAVSNLAPLPSAIANSKYKGIGFAAIGIFLAMKSKNRRVQSASAGLAAYGIISVAKQFFPSVAALGAVDSRYSVIGGSATKGVIGSARTSVIGETPTISQPRSRVLTPMRAAFMSN